AHGADTEGGEMATTSGTYRVCSEGPEGWARVVRLALAACAMTERELADRVGVCVKQIDRWKGTAERIAPIPLHRVASLPEAAQRVIVEALASRLGLVVAEAPPAAELHSDARAIGALARECGEAVGALGDAMADGVLTAGEADRVARECMDAMSALATVMERCREVQRERVVGVRLREVAG
ncbi:MAG TPA: phage regulatory CII family protein, partial [Kofleriaceae bacterium]|nr:phage regulatory CII family protein [Kofleriaceae bacterium]